MIRSQRPSTSLHAPSSIYQRTASETLPRIGRKCNEFSKGSSRRGFWPPANWGFTIQTGRLLGASRNSLQNRAIRGNSAGKPRYRKELLRLCPGLADAGVRDEGHAELSHASISSRTMATSASTSDAGHSKSNSSCTCRIILAAKPRHAVARPRAPWRS